jgi:hypothetical protein
MARAIRARGRTSTADDRFERRMEQECPTIRPADAGYDDRDAALREIGFADYAAYLRSELWATIRAAVLDGSPSCVLCPRPARQVHHTEYSHPVLLGGDRGPLKPVCAGCHKRVEFRGKEKRTFAEASREFARLLKLASSPKHRAKIEKRVRRAEQNKAKLARIEAHRERMRTKNRR